jgi:hypothetical protein
LEGNAMTTTLDDLERLAKAVSAEQPTPYDWQDYCVATVPAAILELVAEVRVLRERLDVPYRASSDCQYAGASEQIKCAWADGWNQCVQYIKGSHDGY